MQNRTAKEIYILDAPGITGMGANGTQLFKSFIENGGDPIIRALLLPDGSIQTPTSNPST